MPRGKPMPIEEFMERMESYSPALKRHRRLPHNGFVFCQECCQCMKTGGDRARYIGKTIGRTS